MDEWYSSWNVADPKSISRISVFNSTRRCEACLFVVVEDEGIFLLYVNVW